MCVARGLWGRYYCDREMIAKEYERRMKGSYDGLEREIA